MQVKWLKGDKIIKPSKYFQMSRQADTNTLRVSEVFPEDEGEYKCIVSNEAGTAEVRAPLKVLGTFSLFFMKCFLVIRVESSFFAIHCISAPESTDALPVLSPMKNVTVEEGAPATFSTQVTAKQKPTIQWYR